MALVSPAKPRATLAQTAQGLEVVIPARRNWFLTVFLGAWLVGWVFGAIAASRTLLSDDVQPGAILFMTVWLTGWTIGGGFAAYTFLWSLMGKERILLTPSRLAIKRELLGRGRVREYEVAHIHDLRVAPSTYNLFDFRAGLQFWGIGGGLLAFDHGAATIRFGAGLEEGEAKSVRDRLLAYGPLKRSAG